MAYHTTIRCNRCSSERVVTQPGMLPVGWIQLLRAKNPLNARLEPQGPQAEMMTFCGWKCLVHKGKEFLAHGEDVEVEDTGIESILAPQGTS